MWVVKAAEMQADLISAKALVKTIKQKIVPVRVLDLSGDEKVISKNTDVRQEKKNNNRQNLPVKKNVGKMWRNG